MEWKVFQKHMKTLLGGGATVVVDREKIKSLNNQGLKMPDSCLQDIAPECLGVEDACWTGYQGWLYRVRNKGRVITINLTGRLIYSKNDVDQSVSKRIIVPIEAIESISF